MRTTDATDTRDPDPSERSQGLLDRVRAHPRALAVTATGLVVVVALVVGLATVLTGDDSEDPPPPPQPLTLAPPTDLSSVFSVEGGTSQLSPQELTAITETIEGYLRAATIEPLEFDPEVEGATPPSDLARFFTDAAKAGVEGDDRLALSDAHLPHAAFGVSTEEARVTGISALVGPDGGGLLAAATIDVQMRVRTGRLELPEAEGERIDAVVVHRTGELVLQPVDGAWRIGGYDIDVTREFGSAVTTTSEAAFGVRLP